MALLAFFTTQSANFLTVTNILVMAQSASILMVIALGATLVVVAGSVDLSVGAVATIVGVLAAHLSQQGHTSSIWLLVLVGALCGLVNGILVAYVRLPSFLVTLGTMFIFGGIAAKITGGYFVSLNYPSLSEAVNGKPIGQIPAGLLWMVVAIAVSAFLAYRTVFGRRVYAIGGNEKVAKLAGQPVERTKVWMFVFSGLLAGFGGLMLVARAGGSSPDMGEPFLLTAIAAIVMGGTSLNGGVGGPARTIVGVVIIEVLTNGLIIIGADPYYQNIALGSVIICAVIVTIKRSEMAAIK
ncbi:putative ABC transporter permease protein [Nocardioides sp. PD653]|nr:putative ABC transporter permease protein [Nocardioides sp. PD653]